MSPSMTGRTLARAVALTLALQVGLVAAGQGPLQAGEPKQREAGPTRTGKERLSGKASDEQRVDNCKVLPERRGKTARSASCAQGAKAGVTH
jgi:hypothetical protein